MSTKPAYQFGKYQPFVSDKMRQRPKLSKIINSVFGYTAMGAYGRQLIFKKLLNYVPMDKVRTIMDLGCGQGEFSFMLADAHKDAVIDAVDLDTHAINKIQKTIDHFRIENLRAYNVPIEKVEKKDYYDLIFSVDVFEHIKVENMPFNECYRKLKKGGYLIIKMPNKVHQTILPNSWFEEFNEWQEDEHIGQVYDLPDLTKRFEDEGFKIVTSFYSDGIIARAGWEFNYIMMKGGSIMHLISLPISKGLMKIDKLFRHKKKGNYIQVVGQKL